MSVDVVLYNCKIYVHGNLVEAGLAIDKGKIVKIAKHTNLPSASTKMNLKGHMILPGLIDCHVHLRDQQLAYKEDFVTGTAAAAAGGVTSVIDMPNNNPVTLDSLSLKERMKQAEKRVLVNVAFNSAFPKNLEEISEIVKAGAVGFKVYLSNNIGGIDVDDDGLLFAAFMQAKKNGILVAVHAEDNRIIEDHRRELEAAGQNDAVAYVRAHSPEAEAQSIQRIIRLVTHSSVHVHFCHISSALGLDAVLVGKNAGLPVTCEVTPHHLLLTSDQYNCSELFALTDPPLRTREDVAALWSALKRGFIDVIASDHAPHTIEEKSVDSVWKVKPGIPGLETILSLLLSQVNDGRLTLSELVRLTAEGPAKTFNLNDRGFLSEGKWADIVVVDLKQEYEINSSAFFSKAKYSPFDGMRLKGKPVKTFVNGKLVIDDGELVTSVGAGHIIRGGLGSS